MGLVNMQLYKAFTQFCRYIDQLHYLGNEAFPIVSGPRNFVMHPT